MAITLSKTDFVPLGLIAKHCDDSKLQIAIKEAILFDMDKVWCGLFKYLEDNWESTDAKWVAIRDAKDFTGCDDVPTSHVGAKQILIYYAYARYIVLSGFDDSASGLVQKQSDFSIPKTLGEVNAFANKYVAMGIEAFKKLRSYITIEKDTYTELERLYGLDCGCVDSCVSKSGYEKTTVTKFRSKNISKEYD